MSQSPMRVLFITPDLEYRGRNKQLHLLAANLPCNEFQIYVAALGTRGPVASSLEFASVPVETLGWARRFNLTPLLRLRRLISAFQPDLIHAWGPLSVQLTLLTRRQRIPVVASQVGRPVGISSRLQRWWLRYPDRLVASGPSEAEAYHHIGVSSEQLVTIPPGVEIICPEDPDTLSSASRLLLALGPLEHAKGYRDAIWIFDILQYLYEDLRLALVGTGPERPRLEQFARDVQAIENIHFTGACESILPWLHQAQVVWVLGHRGGVNTALQAMAAGRPVLASHRPELAEIIQDGVTGRLASPSDKVSWARATRQLLQDRGTAHALAEAGRQWVRRRFSVQAMVSRFGELYRELVGAKRTRQAA
jgi:glycosyltransferase involved in cell wall biosynthesis